MRLLSVMHRSMADSVVVHPRAADSVDVVRSSASSAVLLAMFHRLAIRSESQKTLPSFHGCGHDPSAPRRHKLTDYRNRRASTSCSPADGEGGDEETQNRAQ